MTSRTGFIATRINRTNPVYDDPHKPDKSGYDDPQKPSATDD